MDESQRTSHVTVIPCSFKQADLKPFWILAKLKLAINIYSFGLNTSNKHKNFNSFVFGLKVIGLSKAAQTSESEQHSYTIYFKLMNCEKINLAPLVSYLIHYLKVAQKFDLISSKRVHQTHQGQAIYNTLK